jgi:hypothetical protein
LQQLHTSGDEVLKLVDTVHNTLSYILWHGSVQGFSEKDDILHLHHFATMKWLTTAHENQMVNLLRFDVGQNSTDSWEYSIESTGFILALISAFDHHHTFQCGPSIT